MRVFNIACFIIISLCSIGCIEDGGHLWADGKIPFVTSGFTQDENKIIMECAIAWSSSGIKMYPASSIDNHILYIIKENDPGVEAGLTLGYGYNYHNPNIISIARFEKRYVLHEMGHKIGLHHEHQRPDRDLYLNIKKTSDEISGLDSQVIPQEPELLKNYADYPYDYDSIMHYCVDEFSICGYDVDTKHGDLYNESLSAIDIIKVSDMYKDEARNEVKP